MAKPEYQKSAFNCPFCGAFAQQVWYVGSRKAAAGHYHNLSNIEVSSCEHCHRDTLWYVPEPSPLPRHIVADRPKLAKVMAEAAAARMIWPATSLGPMPAADLPKEVKSDFVEARGIVAASPRGAAALLRLCVQKLCIELGESGKNLNDDIGALVAKGLPEKIQQSLDTVRVVGNNSVHPGELDHLDDLDIALQLFELVNLIAEVMITQPKRVEAMYERVMSPGQKEQVEKRDAASED